MKKIKPIHWVLIAIAVYYLFIRKTSEVIMEDEIDPNSETIGMKKLCSGKKCKRVNRRGILGIGRQVAKDWCHHNGTSCVCLDAPCGGRG